MRRTAASGRGRAGPGGGRPVAQRAGVRLRHVRGLAGRRRVRAGQPTPARGRAGPRPFVDRSRRGDRRRRRTRLGRARPLATSPTTAFVTWTSGTTGQPKPILQTHSGYLELLDRVLGPLRGRPADPSRPPSPNLVPGVARLECRHLQRPVRVPGRRLAGAHGPLQHCGVRLARAAGSPFAPPSAARRHGDARRRPGGQRSVAAALRPEHHRAAFASGGSSVHRESSGSPCSTATGRLKSERSSDGRPPTPGIIRRRSERWAGLTRGWPSRWWRTMDRPARPTRWGSCW